MLPCSSRAIIVKHASNQFPPLYYLNIILTERLSLLSSQRWQWEKNSSRMAESYYSRAHLQLQIARSSQLAVLYILQQLQLSLALLATSRKYSISENRVSESIELKSFMYSTCIELVINTQALLESRARLLRVQQGRVTTLCAIVQVLVHIIRTRQQ